VESEAVGYESGLGKHGTATTIVGCVAMRADAAAHVASHKAIMEELLACAAKNGGDWNAPECSELSSQAVTSYKEMEEAQAAYDNSVCKCILEPQTCRPLGNS
jgi:hypothetical protein